MSINRKNPNERRAGATVETGRQGSSTNPLFATVSMEERSKEKHLLHADIAKNLIRARASDRHPQTEEYDG